MPMNIPGMAGEMKTEIEAVFGVPADNQRLLDFTTALSKAIINHIKNNATITLAAADIQVPGAGLFDGTSAPVTGIANNAPATLNTKIS